MPRKIDLRRIEEIEDRANEAEDAYWQWESDQLEALGLDYDTDDYPVIRHPNTTQYERPYRRSQQVTLMSRSTDYE